MEYELTTPQSRIVTQIVQSGTCLQYWLQELLQAEASPQRKAFSFSLGTLISLLPTPGLNILLATILAAWFKQLHKASLLAAMGVWNAFVIAPLYALAYRVGVWLFGDTVVSPGSPWLDHLMAYGKSFLVGNLLIAVVLTLLSYALVKTLASRR